MNYSIKENNAISLIKGKNDQRSDKVISGLDEGETQLF